MLLTLLFLATGCPPPEAASPKAAPPPAPQSKVSSSASQAIAEQLESASLLHEPMPARTVTPILRKLVDEGWDVGAKLDVSTRRIRSRISNWRKVNCYEVRFTSHQWRGKPVRIFGYYAHPAFHGETFPALLLVHGGGGYATIERVVKAAGRGYAALSIDLPGKGTLRENHSRSTGPDMTVERIFTVKPKLTDNYIYHAVLAQMRAVTFLRTREQVDRERIGLVGVSWGGATGLITTSLDKRIKCFVNVYGSGFLRGACTWHEYLDTLPPEEFDAWERHFDASRYVADINVPVLGLTGTNDNCYYLPRFLKTMRGIEPTPPLLLRPNLDHKLDDPAREGYYKWLAVQLKGLHAKGPPALRALRIGSADEGVRVFVRPGGCVAVGRAEVSYGKVGNIGWTNREWKQVACAPDDAKAWWSAKIPLPSQVTYAFATVYFVDGSVLSTPVHSVATAVIAGETVVLDVAYMYQGSVRAEAHHLAALVGGEVAPASEPGRPKLTRNGWEAHPSAVRLGDLLFVRLRETCAQWGGIVDWRHGQLVISLPSRPKA